ncbi:sulfide/dihydroorotate dehydrogenase-like FAD/NAD-binding protein [Candidatus Hecatella orcuttiae]|uniref:sulfide/dihydroorotate dehydrogenase-like FAD/NAD-binding protein n=1 Tax=Candidatus Hecatella orcuttiae TaxID=1935119 RepID=UPI002867D688|nr:sulfide/dihydroorotate dehydrogenase-like FAD/NAD-binding protein [Candidatus Hecatella orcuttiae]
MNDIVSAKELAPNIKQFEILAPPVATKVRPGHFVVLQTEEEGERIPLTVVDSNPEKGTVTLVFLEIGASTKKLGKLKQGNRILHFVGPLGNPSEIEKFGQVVCVGGGIGAAAIYPIVKALKAAGNRVISIIGARNKDLLIYEEELRKVSDELYVTTDDGSKGRHGFVSDVLKELLEKGIPIDRVIAVGPAVMMKVISNLTKPFRVKTIVSLNPIMVDATGMCGCCRVYVSGETKFACVDGPEFDGHQVDFDNLLARLRTYVEEEKLSHQMLEKGEG